MLNKLINMAKNEMFDTAFLLAEKNNLENELHYKLSNGYLVSKLQLKNAITRLTKYDSDLLDIHYNIEMQELSYGDTKNVVLNNLKKIKNFKNSRIYS